jgi:hypothetical protein
MDNACFHKPRYVADSGIRSQVVTPAFFLPVARKYFVRMFGGEHPHFLDVLIELFT